MFPHKIMLSLALATGILLTSFPSIAGDVTRLADVSEYLSENPCKAGALPYSVWRENFVLWFVNNPDIIASSKVLNSEAQDVFMENFNNTPPISLIVADHIEIFKSSAANNFFITISYEGCLVGRGESTPTELKSFMKIPAAPTKGRPYKFNPNMIKV